MSQHPSRRYISGFQDRGEGRRWGFRASGTWTIGLGLGFRVKGFGGISSLGLRLLCNFQPKPSDSALAVLIARRPRQAQSKSDRR